MKGKLANCTEVAVYGSVSVITALEFFEHYFAKVGHSWLLMTRPYPFTPTFTYIADTQHAKASAATQLRSNGVVAINPNCRHPCNANRGIAYDDDLTSLLALQESGSGW